MTPPAVLVYLPSNTGGIKKEKDQDGFRHKNWIVRCVPNLYPAFTPPDESDEAEVKESPLLARAIGHHEVLIESPNHDEHPGEARISQLIHVINAYLDRLKALSSKTYVRYVSIFRNHGREAGASLSHAHTQIIAAPFVPAILEEELGVCRKRWKENGECAFCEILRKERGSQRFIWENKSFLVFAPWASVNPLEFWIAPKRHQPTLLDISDAEVEDLAKVLRLSFGGLKSLLNDPPYNFGFHLSPSREYREYYHWHLEVYPKLAIWAGFEKSSGMYINTVQPEDAAADLRDAILKEKKRL
jgi:UDPglucose--hexose-1-phosphate uridylyltransferase